MATTALHVAARDGNVERVQEIVEGRNGQVKVSINTQNAIGQTPIHLAAKWGRLNVIKFLIEAGADLEITDRKGRTPLHEADDSIVQTHLMRHSQKLRTTMDVSKMSMANTTFDLKQQRRSGDITEVELGDALERLEASGVWSFKRLEEDIEKSEAMEAVHNAELEEIAQYMRDRPEEIKNELFKQRHKLMRKREKEDERARLEAKRLKEVQLHEERRQKEKEREEKKAVKELHRPRICGKCGQEYTNDKNRGGQCVHKGEWANWGTNSKGEKVEWLFYWTCCKSQTYEGPAGGHSCCSRSNPHEESHADIARRAQKERKKESTKNKKG